MNTINNYNLFLSCWIRFLLAFIAFAVGVFPFAYYSDFVADWNTSFIGEPPQFEALVLCIGLVLASPLISAIAVGILFLSYRFLVLTWPLLDLQVTGTAKSLIFHFLVSLAVALALRVWIRSTSCCPTWQCNVLTPGLGSAIFVFLLVFFRQDILIKRPMKCMRI